MRQYLANIFLLFIPFILDGCQKERLEGNFEVLVGKWEWYHSYGTGSTNRPGAIDVTPEAIGISYEIEFIEKGKFTMWKNGEEFNKGRVIDTLGSSITVKGNEFEKSLVFTEINSDTIYFLNWPTDFINTRNYFSRIE